MVETIEKDPHPEDTVRVGAVTTGGEMDALGRALVADFAREAFVHHFPALPGGGDPDAREATKAPRIELVEAFPVESGKWPALRALADERGIAEERIAAIGDELNDAAMIRHAAIGIAMGNAVDAVRRVARHVTETNAEDGVARALERLVEGVW